jgi:DNA-binding transcriptional ArsR family regulator
MATTRPRRTEFKVGRRHPPTLRDVADPKALERAFKALANETRRDILAVLHDNGGELSSHDIARRFDLPWQGVSRHLRLLTEAGLLTCDVRRNERAYALNHEQLRRVPGRWIARVASEGRRDRDGRMVFDFADPE